MTWKTTQLNSLPLQTANACPLHGDYLHEYLKPFHASARALVWYEDPCEQKDSQYFTELDAGILSDYHDMLRRKDKESWEPKSDF